MSLLDKVTTYTCDGKEARFHTQPIEEADAASFQILNETWARDGQHVYSNGEQIDADPSSFMVLNHIYAKDKDCVYTVAGVLLQAEVQSFEVLDHGVDLDGYRGFGRDANSVYFHVETIGKPSLLRGANPEEFKSLGYGYGADSKLVFFEKARLPKADPSNWRRLGGYYSTDGTRVFYCNSLIQDADAGSLQALPAALTWARDSKLYFDTGEPAKAKAYLKQLGRHHILVGSVLDQREVFNGQWGFEFEVRANDWLYSPKGAERPEVITFKRFGEEYALLGELKGKQLLFFLDHGQLPGSSEKSWGVALDWHDHMTLDKKPLVENLLKSL